MTMSFTTSGATRGALPGPHVSVGLVPDPLAVGGVEREHVGIRRDKEDLSLSHRDPTVHVPAAQGDVVGDRVLVPPDLHARLRVEGPDPAVPAGDEHDPVDDDRGGLERVGRCTRDHAARAGLEDPRGAEVLDVLRVDLVQRAVPLSVVGAVVGEPVLGLRAGIANALVGDIGDHRRRDLTPGDLAAQQRLVDGFPCVYVFNCHRLLLSTAAAVRGDRGEPPAGLPPVRRWRRSVPGLRRCLWVSCTSSSPGRRG